MPSVSAEKKELKPMHQESIRTHLLHLLQGDGAHADFDTAIKDLPADLRGKRPEGASHSLWEVLEHLRIAQRDILDYIHDVKHVSPDVPDGYWPSTPAPSSPKQWEHSVEAFRSDFAEALRLANGDSTDLLAPLHNLEDQTILRKLLMLADHNSYHLGELVLLRRLLGSWSS
jgi:hypothetical protein